MKSFVKDSGDVLVAIVRAAPWSAPYPPATVDKLRISAQIFLKTAEGGMKRLWQREKAHLMHRV